MTPLQLRRRRSACTARACTMPAQLLMLRAQLLAHLQHLQRLALLCQRLHLQLHRRYLLHLFQQNRRASALARLLGCRR